jgi:hypothetical protein
MYTPPVLPSGWSCSRVLAAFAPAAAFLVSGSAFCSRCFCSWRSSRVSRCSLRCLRSSLSLGGDRCLRLSGLGEAPLAVAEEAVEEDEWEDAEEEELDLDRGI